MKKMIIANWKMNPRTAAQAIVLARASDAKDVIVCPPYPFLPAVAKVLKRAALGAQNAAPGVVGPRTGEVSVGELKDIGVQYVIVGHSERRAEGERDVHVAAKIAGVLAAGLTPILCVGEPWSVRKKGIGAARAYVKKQLTEDLKLVNSRTSNVFSLYVAYEPVWAISTSKDLHVETPADAAAMAKFILLQLKTLNLKRKTSALYGGSVNSKNAASFLRRREFAGTLVGGASLRPAEFKKIIAAGR